jgi:polyhydroxyalkanoate synthesis repressor PhaR
MALRAREARFAAATALLRRFSTSPREANLPIRGCECGSMILQAPSTDVIRIRKYPNRRLYDTSRSTHLTHDEVLAIVRRGLRVQISDSRTETDITNEVLLQILIARDPALVASLPTGVLLSIARSTPESVVGTAGGLTQAPTQATDPARVAATAAASAAVGHVGATSIARAR